MPEYSADGEDVTIRVKWFDELVEDSQRFVDLQNLGVHDWTWESEVTILADDGSTFGKMILAWSPEQAEVLMETYPGQYTVRSRQVGEWRGVEP